MSDSLSTLARASSANVSDALRMCGLSFQAADGGIRPVHPDFRLVAPVFTVRCYPGATWALEQALEKASPGDAIVVDGGASPDVILMGGLMSLRFKKRGIKGVVMDGAVRDVDDIIRLQFPVFSRYICPRAGVFAEVGELQTTICCGRIPVSPGDYVVADVSGVVFVPGARLNEVAVAVERILEKEAFLEERLSAGESLPEAAGKFKPKPR